MGCGRSRLVIAPEVSSISRLSINSGTFVGCRSTSLYEDYEVGETIGSGAFAQVKRVIHRATGSVRAVKIVHKSGVEQDQIDAKHRLRELKILKELDHPHILRVFDLYEDKMRYYVVMEYCAGGELFARLSQQKMFSEADAAHIMSQVLSAVSYCHERRVIHRDLKPENLLLESNTTVLDIKIADFGSSAFIDVHKKLNGVFGSPYYVAPEVLKQAYNEKCDLWSCGILMYVLLTGKPPYQGSNEREVMQAVTLGALSLKFLSTVSEPAQDLLNCLLTRSVKDRISAKEAMLHPWVQDAKYRRGSLHASEVSNVLAELSSFHNSAKLKDAIQTYIASQIMTHAEIRELKEAFLSIDRNGDGKLSREELAAMYRTTLAEAEAQKEVDTIMRNVDTDQSGFIDYTEFLKASLDQRKHLSKKMLETTFRAFDTDGNGVICIEELKSMMRGLTADDDTWRAIISEVDQNGDGLVDLREFQEMIMRRL